MSSSFYNALRLLLFTTFVATKFPSVCSTALNGEASSGEVEVDPEQEVRNNKRTGLPFKGTK